MPITIESSSTAWAKLERELADFPRKLGQARYQAIKRTADQGRRMVADKFLAQYPNVQRSKLETGDSTKRGRPITSRVTGGEDPIGTITVTQQPLPLIAFKPKGPGMRIPSLRKPGGVTVQLSTGRSPLTFRHAFRAVMRSGHEGIYRRVRATSGGKWKPGWKHKTTASGFAARLPVEELFGPTVYQLVNVPKVNAEVVEKIDAILVKNINSQLARFRPMSVA